MNKSGKLIDCVYRIWCNKDTEFEECMAPAQWEVGFSPIIQNDSSGFLAGGDVSITQFLCDKHFIGLNGCGNCITFREIGNEEWLNFDDYDNPHLLKNLVKKKNIRNKLKQKELGEWS